MHLSAYSYGTQLACLPVRVSLCKYETFPCSLELGRQICTLIIRPHELHLGQHFTLTTWLGPPLLLSSCIWIRIWEPNSKPKRVKSETEKGKTLGQKHENPPKTFTPFFLFLYTTNGRRWWLKRGQSAAAEAVTHIEVISNKAAAHMNTLEKKSAALAAAGPAPLHFGSQNDNLCRKYLNTIGVSRARARARASQAVKFSFSISLLQRTNNEQSENSHLYMNAGSRQAAGGIWNSMKIYNCSWRTENGKLQMKICTTKIMHTRF